jgi:hypothetical protein
VTAVESNLTKLLDFYRAEANHWRAVALTQAAALKGSAQLIREARYTPLPPEPPVGTLFRDHDGDVRWRRETDGWHCDGTECKNCPVDWSEAHEYIKPTWDRELLA